jgi:hypothetical protein|tara:strand:- start:73 stop:555 length:483 start_codon:yes stop_codon:yes gene_type:complete
MKFTPDWILKLTCSCAAVNFVMGQLPLRAFANSYAKGLRLHYDDATGEKIEEITQGMLYFLATFESDDHLEYVNSFMFNNIKFEQNGQKRKLKPMFKSILEPEKTETSEDATLKHFKKFVFTLRNDRKLAAPKHWKLTDTKDIDTLLKIYARRVRVTDAF